jgi:hypothetical protein
MRRLVLELEEAEFRRLEKEAYARPMPDYIRAFTRSGGIKSRN